MVLVIGETDSPSATNGLEYFSTPNNYFFLILTTALALKFENLTILSEEVQMYMYINPLVAEESIYTL